MRTIPAPWGHSPLHPSPGEPVGRGSQPGSVLGAVPVAVPAVREEVVTVSVLTSCGTAPAGLDGGGIRLLWVAAGVQELIRDEPGRADVVVVDFAAADHAERVAVSARLSWSGRRVLAVGVPDRVDAGMDVARAGVAGFLTGDRSPLRVAAAVREVADRAGTPGSPPGPGLPAPRLSSQERVVLVGYASGMTLIAAARRAGVRPATAKKYLDRVKQKYAECGRASYTKVDLAVRAREDGLLDVGR